MTYTENDITVEMWKDEARTKENGKEYNRNLSHKKAITALQQADKSTRLDKEKYYYSQEHVCDIEHTSRNISEEEYWRRANALTEKRIKELYGNEKGQVIVDAIYYHTHHPELSRREIGPIFGIGINRYKQIISDLQKDNYLRCIPGMIYGDDSFIWSPTDGRKERRKKSKNQENNT